MKKKVLITSVILFAAPLLLTGINIAQNGSRTPDGRSLTEILGVPAEEATADDVARLNKADVMQLFYTAGVPAPDELNGEYHAVLIDAGVLAPASAFYTHHLFGDGRWLGKGLRPPAIGGGGGGRGYNLFANDSEGEAATTGAFPDSTRRMRVFATYRGPSQLDGRESFHLDYGAYNSGTVQSMRDEIRRINSRLYLGMGHMALGGGAINPAPFLLIGPPEPLPNDSP